MDVYLKALEKEMLLHKGQPIDTLYFGGGTPSILSVAQWKRSMARLRSCFVFAPDMEITIECNPENIHSKLVQTYIREGVNRLSLGLQTSNNSLLKKIGRMHTWENFSEAYSICRQEGVKNINLDLIFGLPRQTFKNWKETLRQVLDLRPEHLSFYPLDIEKRSAFYFDGISVDLDLQADMFEWAQEQMEAHGYEQYEVVNYSLPGFNCRHNLKYWKNLPTLGIGLSAASFDGKTRSHNRDKFWDYIKAIKSGKSPTLESETLFGDDRLREEILLGLRLKEGIRYSHKMDLKFGSTVKRLTQEGFLQFSSDGQRISATLKGWLLSSHVYKELLN